MRLALGAACWIVILAGTLWLGGEIRERQLAAWAESVCEEEVVATAKRHPAHARIRFVEAWEYDRQMGR